MELAKYLRFACAKQQGEEERETGIVSLRKVVEDGNIMGRLGGLQRRLSHHPMSDGFLSLLRSIVPVTANGQQWVTVEQSKIGRYRIEGSLEVHKLGNCAFECEEHEEKIDKVDCKRAMDVGVHDHRTRTQHSQELPWSF